MRMTSFNFVFIFLALWAIITTCMCVHRVGIIGAGFGGASVAFHLRQLLGNKVEIDVYEKTDRVGGRVKTIEFAGRKFEAGGSIIHSKNKYVVDLAQKLGLYKKTSSNSNEMGLMGIHDGEKFVFEESRWRLVTLMRVFSKYGLDPLKIQALIRGMLKDFSHIYFYQNRNVSFSSVDDLLLAMNHKFPEYVRISLREHLQDVKLHNDTIEQLIESIALVNYGQNVDQLHAFVGSVSTSGADFGGELWAVEGGNQQIPQKMLVSCNAHVILNTEIVKIVRQKSSFQVIDMKGNEKLYDSVVIAHPLPLSTLKFSNFDVSTSTNIEKEMNRGNYHQTVATFIAGKRSGNLSLPEIDEVMICDPSYPYQSIAKQTPVEKYDLKTCETCAIDVFKIFSREILTQDQLSFLFDDVSYKLVIPWLAYPEYKKMESTPFFVLSPGLFYVNAIEWAASAMEMSLVGGRNVALLLQDFLKDTVKQRK